MATYSRRHLRDSLKVHTIMRRGARGFLIKLTMSFHTQLMPLARCRASSTSSAYRSTVGHPPHLDMTPCSSRLVGATVTGRKRLFTDEEESNDDAPTHPKRQCLRETQETRYPSREVSTEPLLPPWCREDWDLLSSFSTAYRRRVSKQEAALWRKTFPGRVGTFVYSFLSMLKINHSSVPTVRADSRTAVQSPRGSLASSATRNAAHSSKKKNVFESLVSSISLFQSTTLCVRYTCRTITPSRSQPQSLRLMPPPFTTPVTGPSTVHVPPSIVDLKCIL